MGLHSELKLAVPWGHIALKVWGSQKNPPVLCLHGWLDNANSFDRLIPLLPQDFCYMAMDFGGHGLSSHYNPGLPYYQQNFVSEVRRVATAFKWNQFTLLGHSFGGCVGGTFACMFPEMVDKLILLDSTPFFLDSNEMENILTYRRRNIEHTLQVEASQKKSLRAVSPEEMLQGAVWWLLPQSGCIPVSLMASKICKHGTALVIFVHTASGGTHSRFLNNNSHLDKDCGELILQRGTTKVDAGLVLNRDRRISWPENSFDFVSKEMFVHSAKSLQASVLMIKALQGYYDVRRANDADKAPMHFMVDTLRSTLKERFQFVEVPGNHYIHMNKPQVVAGVVGPFLQGLQRMTSARL